MHIGPGKEIYAKGAGGAKGHEGSEEKLYCQVKHLRIRIRECVCMASAMWGTPPTTKREESERVLSFTSPQHPMISRVNNK